IGGLGSAIAWTGRDDLYVATPDRGPADGATTYIDRLYTLQIRLTRVTADRYTVSPSVIDTRLLRNADNQFFTGSAAAFDPTQTEASLRLDPEGVRVSRCGDTVFVSDEYGPFLYEFKRSNGKRLHSLALPKKLLIDFPSADPNEELSRNACGRQANRGMEGLAISPDGTRLYGLMQSPLIQDGGLDATNRRVGTNSRLIEIELATGAVREFLYTLEDRRNGVNEILAINDHEFLVIERDGNAGTDARFKKIFKIDISGATDIRGIKQLPSTEIPPGIAPVAKSLFIDLLDPAFGLAGAAFPEKIEGLAFGPDLEDGRHLLLVTSDNDFIAAQDTLFFAFAIEPATLPGFQPQAVGRGGAACAIAD
ncbi:MAG TPA: esterase-like activity of phytase family protein, partial [Burkholderiales bacterium]